MPALRDLTGQYIVGRIYRHEAELSLGHWRDWVYTSVCLLLTKALAGAVDFCIDFFLINFTKPMALVGLSAPPVWCFVLFFPSRARLGFQSCRVGSHHGTLQTPTDKGRLGNQWEWGLKSEQGQSQEGCSSPHATCGSQQATLPDPGAMLGSLVTGPGQ